MTGQKFANYVRKLAGVNSSELPDADLVLFANAEKNEIAFKMLKASEDVFLTPQTTNLSADTREYPFPEDVLNKIKRVEAKLDGTNWIRIFEMDLSQYSGTSDEDSIVANFNNQQYHPVNNPNGARYDNKRTSIYIYSGTITDVTGGLKAFFEMHPADITTAQLADDTDDLSKDPTATTYGMPKEFHQIWAKMTARSWKESKEKPIPESLTEQVLRPALNEKILEYTPVSTERVDQMGLPTSYDTYNNGYDL